MKTNQHPLLIDFELSDEAISELKTKFGKIYLVPVGDFEFVVRTLSKGEWETVMSTVQSNPNMTIDDVNEKIVTYGLICPQPDAQKGGWTGLPAGLVPTLSSWIQAKSGFIVPELDIPQPRASTIGDVIIPVRPSTEDIDKLKAGTPFPIKEVIFEEESFVIRPITRQEWKVAAKRATDSGDDMERDEEVCNRCVLWPKKIDWNAKPAGYCPTLSNMILTASGYNSTAKVQEL